MLASFLIFLRAKEDYGLIVPVASWRALLSVNWEDPAKLTNLL